MVEVGVEAVYVAVEWAGSRWWRVVRLLVVGTGAGWRREVGRARGWFKMGG